MNYLSEFIRRNRFKRELDFRMGRAAEFHNRKGDSPKLNKNEIRRNQAIHTIEYPSAVEVPAADNQGDIRLRYRPCCVLRGGL